MTKLLILPRRLATTLLWIPLLCSTLPLQGQDLRLHLSEDTVTVGQRFFVSIAAEHDFVVDPLFPEPSDSLRFGDLEVLARTTRERLVRDETRIDSVVYEVTTFALDTATVAPIRIIFTAGEDTFAVATDPAHLAVTSLVPADAQDVRDLAPLVEFPRSIWPYILGGALLLLAAAALAFYLWKRRHRPVEQPPERSEPASPPDVEALARLQALEQVDLARRDAVHSFYVELSDIIRRYLARRLHVNAMESTTRELMLELSKHDTPQPNTRIELQNVLSLADYVKFADAAPDPGDGKRAIATTREIVSTIEYDLRPAEPAEEDV